MPDNETTPEYRAWVEASRTPTAEEVMEQRKKKENPPIVSRRAELGDVT